MSRLGWGLGVKFWHTEALHQEILHQEVLHQQDFVLNSFFSSLNVSSRLGFSGQILCSEKRREKKRKKKKEKKKERKGKRKGNDKERDGLRPPAFAWKPFVAKVHCQARPRFYRL